MRRWCVGCFLVVGLILLGTARPVRAQSQVHRRWGTEDGLPQSSVLSMAVDPRGDLWLGTQEGLARFDGQHFTPLGATSGLHCSVILSVATSASGWIAVGSDGCGAFRVEDGQMHRMPEVPEDARVHELAFTPDGALWLATEDGLLSVAAGSSRWLHHEGAVTALAVGPTGQLDFAVHGRVGRVESGAVRWLDGLGPLPGREITSLARQGSDLWIATREAGLLRAGPSGRRLFTVADGLPSIDVEAVRVLDDGGVWVATANGVARFDGERFVSLQISDGPSNPISLLSHGPDLIFVGDASSGLHLLRRAAIQRLGASEGLGEPVVWSVHQDAHGEIWSGGSHGALGRWVSGRFVPLPEGAGLPTTSILGLTDAPDGSLWAGTGAGLFHWDGARSELFTTADGLPSVTVHAVHFDAEGSLWACTDRGLVRRGRTGRIEDVTELLGMPRTGCLTLAFEPGGAFWVGGPDVLGRVDQGHFTAQPLRARPGVNAMLLRGDELWLATDQGVARLRAGKAAWLDVDHGLFDRQVLALTETAGSFWFTSNKGPFRIPAAELRAFLDGKRESVESVSFGVSDGMANAECNSYSDSGLLRARDGRLWIPTMNGVAILDPAAASAAPVAPVPIIEGVYDTRHQPLGEGPTRVLEPETRDIEVTYSAAEFAHADQVEFRYRLEGNDAKWVYAGGRRSAWYTNLRPRTYRLLVEARLPGGEWSAPADVLTLKLRPHFHETWWFRGGAIVLLLLLIVVGTKARLVRVRRHEAELQRRVDERTAELKAALERSAQSETSFRTLAERLPIALAISRDQELVFANSEVLRITGAPSLEALRQTPLSRFIAADEAEVSGDRRALLAAGIPTALREGKIVRADGGSSTVQLWGFPMVFEGSAASVFLGLDITDRKALELKLQASERMASVGTLAAGVAHEINNPLAYLLSNLTFVSEEIDALAATPKGGSTASSTAWTEVSEALQEARQGAQRVQRIVADLKSFSRPAEAANGPFDLKPVIETTLNLARTEIRHRAQLETKLAELPLVHNDPHRISQVLLNLLVNAGQAIPEGDDQKNRVWLHTGLEADGQVFLEVGDTGCGIPPENLKRLFDPFFTTKPVGVGTGLGLSICHGILEACGGDIQVQSEVGKGSRFRVRLRQAALEAAAPAPAVKQSVAAGTAPLAALPTPA